MVGHRGGSSCGISFELVVELAESHTVTLQTEGPDADATTSQDTYPVQGKGSDRIGRRTLGRPDLPTSTWGDQAIHSLSLLI